MDEGRKNWRVAGMSSSQTEPTMAKNLRAGAEGAMQREKRVRPARKTYCRSERVKLWL